MEHTAKTDAEINEPDGPNVALLRGNNTVCQHGSMSRKCDTCFAEAERDDHAIALFRDSGLGSPHWNGKEHFTHWMPLPPPPANTQTQEA